MLFTVVSTPVVALAYPVSVYFITRWRLESEYKSAILMSESLLPVLKKREGPQDPQAQNVTPSVEHAVSIARFHVSESAALLELGSNFPWRTPKVRKALFTAKNDTTVMLRLHNAAAERLSNLWRSGSMPRVIYCFSSAKTLKSRAVMGANSLAPDTNSFNSSSL